MATEMESTLPEGLLDKIAERLFEAVPRLTRAIAGEAQRNERGVALSFPQIRALGLLVSRPRPPSELARDLGVAPATATEIVDVLVRRGLVERSDQPGDRRRIVLSVTHTGRLRYTAARQRALGMLRAMLAPASADDLLALERGLDLLLALLKASPATRKGEEHAC